jgi:hypothetical protein
MHCFIRRNCLNCGGECIYSIAGQFCQGNRQKVELIMLCTSAVERIYFGWKSAQLKFN